MLYGAKSEGGIKGSVSRVKEYFTDQGLTAADLPAALIFHEVISVGFAAFTWSACYGIQPSVTIARPMAGLPGASKVAGAFDRALAFSDKKVAGMKWLKKVPVVKHAAPRRLTVSLAESLVFRGSIKPITFGVKLYVSYKFVVWGKNRTRASRPACLSPRCRRANRRNTHHILRRPRRARRKTRQMFLLSNCLLTSPSACAPGAASSRVAAFAPRYASPDGV